MVRTLLIYGMHGKDLCWIGIGKERMDGPQSKISFSGFTSAMYFVIYMKIPIYIEAFV